MKKRILAIVLTMAMVLGYASFSAFAETTNRYATGDGASYLFDVTNALDATKYTTTDDRTLTVRQEDGENFIVFNDPYMMDDETGDVALNSTLDAVFDAKFTYGNDTSYTGIGIPEEIPLNEDETNKTLADTMYLAVRMKLNDNSPAFSDETATLRLNLVAADGSYLVLPKEYNHAYRWLDLEDGSMTWAFPQSTYLPQSSEDHPHPSGYEFSGDADGYLMIPFAATSGEVKILKEFLRTSFKGMSIQFRSGPTDIDGRAAKESSWADKELLVGDCFLVSDVETFAKARATNRGVAGKMYYPNGGADTASYAMRIGCYRSFQQVQAGAAVGKAKFDPDDNENVHTESTRQFIHITTLPNGDLAHEITLNPGYTSHNAMLTMNDNYDMTKLEGAVPAAYAVRKKGVPDEIDLTNVKTLAFRIATKDGTVPNEEFSFTISPRPWSGTAFRTLEFKLRNTDSVTYVDLATGTTETLAVSGGSIIYAGNMDGYVLVPISGFIKDSTVLDIDRIKIGWGGYYNNAWQGIYYNLESGFEHGKAFYAGEIFFVEDDAKFIEYHTTDCETAGHKETTIPAVEATCTTTGLTEGKKCSVCGEILVAPTETAKKAHDDKGVIAAVEATCTETGLTEGKKCSMCGEVQVAQQVVEKKAHDQNETIAAVEATCTTTGLTEGKKCSMCGEVQVAQTETAKKDHDQNEIIPEVPASCTATGLTEGKKCSMCGEVQVAQTETPKGAHNQAEIIPAVEATCTTTGLTEGKKCTGCGEVQVAQQVVEKKAHDQNATIAAVEATCTTTGLTEGKKCSMCGEVQVAQQVVEKKAHDQNETIAAVEATCTATGLTEGKKCSVCGEVQVAQQVVEKKAHDKDVDVAPVDATCTTEGTTAGKKCSVCGEVQEGVETVEKLAHEMELKETVAPTATEKGYDLYECAHCDETEQRNFVDALGEEDKEENKEENKEEDKSPATGENSLFVMIMMIVSLGAATVLFATKKNRATK